MKIGEKPKAFALADAREREDFVIVARDMFGPRASIGYVNCRDQSKAPDVSRKKTLSRIGCDSYGPIKWRDSSFEQIAFARDGCGSNVSTIAGENEPVTRVVSLRSAAVWRSNRSRFVVSRSRDGRYVQQGLFHSSLASHSRELETLSRTTFLLGVVGQSPPTSTDNHRRHRIPNNCN